ncbi:MAG: hypothetical protein IJP00_03720 [Firmicutes bacterium]|nr:hypothetical protein [Bacillota bacterium]
MKKIYLVLTKSDTIASKVISGITKGEYSHVSISLDSKFKYMYSFGRKYKYAMLPGGFIHESLYRGVMGDSNTMRCAVYELEITKASYHKLKWLLNYMDENKGLYRYNAFGLLPSMFNMEYERENYFFCSEFVHYALVSSGAIESLKHPSLVRPMDFCELPMAKQIFKGEISQLRTLQITI